MFSTIKEYSEYAVAMGSIVVLFAVTVFLAIVAMGIAFTAAQAVLRGLGIGVL